MSAVCGAGAARRLAGLLVLGCLAGCSGGASGDAAGAGGDAGASPSVRVQTMPLTRGSLARTVSAYGVVQAEPAAQESIVAPLAARVGQLYVRTGQAVRAGSALVLLLPSPSTRASYAQALAAVQVGTQATRHTRELLAQYLATRQQLADAEQAEGDARAALQALQAQGADGPHTLRAPFDAIVTGVSVAVQALVGEGSALLELARPSGLVLTVGVPPESAASIAAADPVRITPVGAGTSYAGRVLERGAIVQNDTGLVPVQVGLPPQRFLPGESAQAVIRVGDVSGYLVPHAAVLIDDDGNPYVVQAVQGAAKLVHVQVLDSQGAQDIISGALDEHDALVLTGNYQAQDGMRLRFAPGDGPPAAAARPATR